MKNLNANFTNRTFLDDSRNPSFDVCDVVLFGVSFDLTASYNKGTWFGPQALLDASWQIEFEVPVLMTELNKKVKIHNAGILEYPRVSNNVTKISAEMVADVKMLAKKCLDENKFLMVFGGEHSITNGIFDALSEKYSSKNVTIIQFDAHLDLRNALEGMKLSHGSVMRRAVDAGFSLVQVGVRDHISQEEMDFIVKNNLVDNVFFCATQPKEFYKRCEHYANNLIFDGEIAEEMIKNICSRIKTEKVWLTFDVDGLDSSVMPGTGTPLPHGISLSSAENFLFKLINYLKSCKKQLIGFDINEVAPELKKDDVVYLVENTVSTRSEMTAALIAYKLLAWQFCEVRND